MNRLYLLPQSILFLIYEYDDTYRHLIRQCFRDIWVKSFHTFIVQLVKQSYFSDKPMIKKKVEAALHYFSDRLRDDDCNEKDTLSYDRVLMADNVKIYIDLRPDYYIKPTFITGHQMQIRHCSDNDNDDKDSDRIEIVLRGVIVGNYYLCLRLYIYNNSLYFNKDPRLTYACGNDQFTVMVEDTMQDVFYSTRT